MRRRGAAKRSRYRNPATLPGLLVELISFPPNVDFFPEALVAGVLRLHCIAMTSRPTKPHLTAHTLCHTPDIVTSSLTMRSAVFAGAGVWPRPEPDRQSSIASSSRTTPRFVAVPARRSAPWLFNAKNENVTSAIWLALLCCGTNVIHKFSLIALLD